MTTKVTRNMLNTSIDDNGTSTAMIIDVNGNVGIGGSPSAKLDVNTGTTNTLAHFHSTDDNAFIEIKDDDTQGYIGVQNDYLYIGSAPSNNTQNINIHQTTGNVAIGATSTSTKVTIQAADSDTVNSSANGHLTFYDDAPFGYYKIRIATTNRDLAFDGYDTDNTWKEILKLDRVDQRINAKGGIMFGSDTAAVNTLDDYEEGTWTPTTTSSVGITNYSSTYTKIGDVVMFRCYVQFGATSSGNSAVIGGLPFTNVGSNVWCACSIWENNAKQPYPLVQDGGESTIQLRKSANGSYHPYSDFSNTQVIVTGTYKTTQ
tara:strand:- start:751 stop:1701 length:951 start_codon:yes stop_codon:yes gene_type:complete